MTIWSIWNGRNGEGRKATQTGAVDKVSRQGGIGVVIRNADGAVMGTRAANYRHIIDPFVMEALQIMAWSLHMIWDLMTLYLKGMP